MEHGLSLGQKATVLVVDDTPDNLILMSGILKELYHVKAARWYKALRMPAT
jgi:putative two-component system response regulator